MKRRENESLEDYKQRRKEGKEITKQKLKGRLVWDSKSKRAYRKE